MRFFAIALACTGLLAFDTARAEAAPPIPNDRMVDVELKQADVHDVLKLLSQVGGKPLVPDACVQGTVDLKLKNTPVSLVLDALALKMHLTYADDGTAIQVGCETANSTSPSPKPQDIPRVTLSVKQTALPDILDQVAKSASLEGVDYKVDDKPKLDLTVRNVRIGTALAALSEESNLTIGIRNKRIYVTAPR